MSPIGRRRSNAVIVTANGDYDLIKTVCPYGTITVDGTGSVVLGRKDSGGAFVAYADGIAGAGGIVADHGIGVDLMFNVVNVAGPITVTYSPGCC